MQDNNPEVPFILISGERNVLNADKSKIRAKIAQQKRILEESGLSKNERATVLEELKSIQSRLSEISAKEKSRTEMNTVRNKVRELIAKL